MPKQLHPRFASSGKSNRNDKKPLPSSRNFKSQVTPRRGGREEEEGEKSTTMQSRGVNAFIHDSSSRIGNNKTAREQQLKKKEANTSSSSVEVKPSAPSVLDIQSEYFQKEFNPKNLPLSEITQLSLAGRGFEDVKNLHLCENLKRLEVHKNKLKNLQFVMQNFKIQHLDAHDNQITSSNETNAEILSLIQNAPNLKVLNLSHNHLSNKLILNSKLLRTLQTEETNEAETQEKKKILKNKPTSQPPSSASTYSSSLLALILNDNNLEELKLEGKFEHLNTIIISRNSKLKKFVDFANVPSLTKFGATETALECLDKSIVTCKKTLQEVRLSHNPQLFSHRNCVTTLEQLEQLESLKLLAISHNKISHQWNTVKNDLVKIIKNNPNLRNLSIVGNFDEHIQNVGAEKFKEEIMELFSNAGISLTHLDDKPVSTLSTEKSSKKGERDASKELHNKTKSTQKVPQERAQKSDDKRKTTQKPSHKNNDAHSYQLSNTALKNAKKSIESSNEDEQQQQQQKPSSSSSSAASSSLDDYQPLQLPKDMQEKLQKELEKRRMAMSEQQLAIQNAQEEQLEKKRKRELVGGYVETSEKHSGVKKLVDVKQYKKKKPNVWRSLTKLDNEEQEESW